MSYKSEFASNNTDLQTILDMVNGLPDKKTTVDVAVTFASETNGPYRYALMEIIIDGVLYSYTGDTGWFDWADDYPYSKTFTVNSGTEITVRVGRGTGYTDGTGGIFHNGVRKDDASATGVLEYTFVVTGETTIVGTGVSGSIGTYYGTIEITSAEATTDTETESTFTPTDSGGTTYKSKFADNNVDLQKILDKVNSL